MIINILMSLYILYSDFVPSFPYSELMIIRESSNSAEVDRNIMMQTSEGLGRDSRRLLDVVEQQRQETLVHREAQHRILNAHFGYTRNIHTEIHNVKPKIDDLLSQVNEILRAGPVNHKPPTATSRFRETAMTAAATAGFLRIFAGTHNVISGWNTKYSGVEYPRIDRAEFPDQALSCSQWVWDDVPDDELTPSIVKDYLGRVFPNHLTIHVEVM